MKKLFLITVLLSIFASSSLFAQWESNNKGTLSSGKKAEITWDTTTIDLGDIKQNEPKEVIFKFKNNGGKPIIITGAKGSCGCTEIDFSRKPILPGKTSEIIVTYDAEVKGTFNKTVTMTMTIEKSKQILHIKGTVL